MVVNDEKLREKAYKILERKGDSFSESFKDSDLKVLLHELDVYQAELQAQNEELLEKEKNLSDSKLEYEVIFMNAPIPYILLDEHLVIKKLNHIADQSFIKGSYQKNISFLKYLAKGSLKIFLTWIDKKSNKKESIKIDLLTKKGHNKFLLNVLDYPLQKNWKLITLTDVQKEEELLLQNQSLEYITNSLYEEKVENYKEILYSLIEMIEKRDPYTAGHSQRVATYSKLIAQALNLSKEDCELIYEAGVLHDIGKIVIPDAILLKPGDLNKIEFNLIKEHTTIGADLLKKIKRFHPISEIIKYHHERNDGSGYPSGLKDDEIPLLSKIMSIADSFDAMTTKRIYGQTLTPMEAMKIICELKGKFFDEYIVNVAKEVLLNQEINEKINQNPISKMDNARFSYFYNDQLTSLFNTNYLDFQITTTKLKNFNYISILKTKNFSKYNSTFSWAKGDIALKNIAMELTNQLTTEMIFRINGDDFIILSKNQISLDIEKLNKLISFEQISFEFSSNSLNHLEITKIKDIIQLFS